METRLFNYEKDYDLVSTWWKERNHAVITKDFLSDYGIMALIDNKPVGVMWLYPVMTTKWSMIRFPIVDPNVSKEVRDSALNLIFDNLHNISRDMGYTHIFCTTNHPGLITRLKKYNYTLDSENCVHFWGGL